MRHPERVLNNLSKHSNHSGYKFERLYRILFNEEMYYRAYQKLSKKQGNTTKGSDGKSIDGTSLKEIKQLIEELREEMLQLVNTKCDALLQMYRSGEMHTDKRDTIRESSLITVSPAQTGLPVVFSLSVPPGIL